jgi:hypothetical protein
MTPPDQEELRPRPVRRLSSGWVVLGGSVLASFVWWLLSPPPKRPAPPPPAVAAPSEPAPAAVVPDKPSEAPAVKPRVTKAPSGGPTEAPAPAAPVQRPLLRVTGDVAGADVFVDRTFVGKTPFETRDIKPGGHQINVSADGYDGISRHVEVLADAPTEVAFALTAVVLDVVVSVVHKHRLGSCEGPLSADVDGVRYAPTEGDDAFRAPLGSLETFVVDYQEKRLRLKVKGGKSFTFTTKAANGDPLFVFHRDVEKARKKLAGGA